MDPSQYQARRATIDDLQGLRSLWQVEQLPALELDRRFTEFQIAVAPDGALMGALALEISGSQGRIHSEVFRDFGLVDTLRPMLWERIQSVARNRGLARLWTLETTPFWREQGFEGPATEAMEKLPAAWGNPAAPWSTLKLKDELLAGMTAEQEFALFREAAAESTAKVMRQARTLKVVSTVVAIIFAIITCIALLGWFRFMQSGRAGHGGAPGQRP